jgi:hypothetical protein
VTRLPRGATPLATVMPSSSPGTSCASSANMSVLVAGSGRSEALKCPARHQQSIVSWRVILSIYTGRLQRIAHPRASVAGREAGRRDSSSRRAGSRGRQRRETVGRSGTGIRPHPDQGLPPFPDSSPDSARSAASRRHHAVASVDSSYSCRCHSSAECPPSPLTARATLRMLLSRERDIEVMA